MTSKKLLIALTLSALPALAMEELMTIELVGTKNHMSEDGRFELRRDGETAYVWDIIDGRKISTLNGCSSVVIEACFSRDNKLIATTSGTNIANVWELSSGMFLFYIETPSPIKKITFGQLGKLISTHHDGKSCLWRADNGQPMQHAEALSKTAKKLEAPVFFGTKNPMSEDKRFELKDNGPRVLELWDNGKKTSTLNGCSTSIEVVYFNPNGQQIVSTSNSGKAHVWDIKTGRFLFTIEGLGLITKIEFPWHGKAITTHHLESNTHLWRSINGLLISKRTPDHIGQTIEDSSEIFEED